MRTLLFSFLLCISIATVTAQFNWEHTSGPEGGGSLYLTSNDSYAFFADDYFLYRTLDGLAWEQLPTSNIWKFAGYGQSIMAEQFFEHPSGQFTRKLIISHDNGESWISCTYPDSLEYIPSMAMCNHGLYIPQGETHRLHKSVDDGQTWETLIPPMTYGYEVQVFENRLYLYNIDEIWRTDTEGENWAHITPPLAQSEYLHSVIGVGENMIIATSDHIWYSQNDGQSWNSHDLPWSNSSGDDLVYNGSAVFHLRGSANVSVSYNFGETWEPLSDLDQSFFSLEVINGVVLTSSYQLGVYRWDNNTEEFIPANSGLYSAPIYDLGYGDGLLWALSGSGVFEFDPTAELWTNKLLPNSLFPYSNMKVGSNGLVVVSDGYQKIYVSQDGGQNWDTRQYDPSFLFGPDQFIYLLDDRIYIWGYLDIALRSDDFGMTWSAIQLPLWSYSGFEFFQNQLIIGSNDALYSSINQGDSWNVLSTVPAGDIWKLLVTENRLFAIVRITPTQHVLYSSTDGITWTYSHAGLPSEFRVNSLEQIAAKCFQLEEKYFLALYDIGTFVSLDSAQTWIPVHLGNLNPEAMGDSVFYAGGHGGVLKTFPSAYGSLISGNVFWDLNGNGLQEAGEVDLPDVQVGLSAPFSINPFYFTTTDPNGAYILGVIPSVLDTLRPFIHSNYIESIIPPYYSTDTPGSEKNFGIHFIPDVNDLSIYSYLGRARPGFDLSYTVTYRNEGTTTQDAMLSVKIDPILDFMEADPAPFAILGDSLVWQVSQLPMLISGRIKLHLHVPVGTPLGTQLLQTCYVSSDQTDMTPENNTHVASRIVVGAYDPNEKEVSPAGGLSRTEIEEGKEVFYTIQFQNTGTYAAERVRITDMIDTALYLPSIRLVASSHTVTEFELNPGGLLEIIFDNILLPDSLSNEVLSHGFVTFAVKRKKSFNAIEPVVNKAGIFFDFNEPIITNEVAFTIREGDPVSVYAAGKSQGSLTIYPNPTSGEFFILPGESVSPPLSLSIYDLGGNLVRTLEPALVNERYPIHGHLASGMYFIEVRSKNAMHIGRVIVHTSD